MPEFLQEGLTVHLLVEIPFHLITIVFNCLYLSYFTQLRTYNATYGDEKNQGIAMNVMLLVGLLARLGLTVYYCVSRSRAERKYLKMSQVQPLVLGTLIALCLLTVWILAFGLAALFTVSDTTYVFFLLIFWIIGLVASFVACILAGLQWRWMKTGDSRATKSFPTEDKVSLKSHDSRA